MASLLAHHGCAPRGQVPIPGCGEFMVGAEASGRNAHPAKAKKQVRCQPETPGFAGSGDEKNKEDGIAAPLFSATAHRAGTAEATFGQQAIDSRPPRAASPAVSEKGNRAERYRTAEIVIKPDGSHREAPS